MKNIYARRRRLASAVAGTALLGVSALTGISAANAASSGGPLGSLSVSAGAVPGSGTATLTSNNVVKSVTTFDNPGCATLPPQYSGANMVPSTITIGTKTYSAPAVAQWHEGPVFSESTLTGIFCDAPDGSVINGVNAKVSQHRLAWQVDYSCQPAGTPVTGTLLADPSSDTVQGSPTTIPASGTLPEACGGTTTPPAALALSSASGAAGSPFVITGTGYHAGESVTLQFHSTPTTLGTVTVTADGSFSLSTAVPSSATPGAHTVSATAPSTGTQTLSFTVTKADGGPGEPSTPGTSTPTPTSTSTPIPTATATATDNGGSPAPTGSGLGSTAGGSPVTTNSGSAAPVGAPATTSSSGRGLGIQTAVASSTADVSGQLVWSVAAGIAGIALVALAFLTGRRRKHV
ncbi:hypothetical protein [Arthrobacter woluwensis]|uniref:hypothetical protein n=1 Tax=Arthrobacter woluwensis TaxID=156980 RepID=UPI0011A469A2|nr:hypothetical protein [Arthrobacter woluwensis]